MQTHNLKQGEKDWHDFRINHYGSSEAASMLGLSPYMSRNALLEYKATGKSKEYSDWFQKHILDNGHRVEALAREIMEREIEDDLFPVTCSEGKLSASCDGLTMAGTIAFECKQWNQDLADFIAEHGTLPDSHMPQCQQILMVTGAEEVIFAVTDGTREKYVTAQVLPDPVWFDRIRSGWSQFSIDLANYQPKELPKKPEPAAIMQLPALSIQIKGEVTVSNLPEFKQAAEKFIADINTDLKTDNDFANAEATVKFCGDTEDKLEAAKAAAIGQTAGIDELMRTIDHIKESIRQKRLTLEKSVKTQKESIKTKIIDDSFRICSQHSRDISLEFKHINFQSLTSFLSRQNFETACKNKRTLASLHNAVDTEVAAIKIKLDDLARVIRKNLTHLPEDLSLFRDLQTIITKQEDDFKLLVESRLAEQKRKEEEAAQRVIAEAKEAGEKAKVQTIKSPDEQLQPVLNNGVVPMSIAEPDSNDRHKKKILNEVYVSLTKHGMNHTDAKLLMAAISRNEILHVTINF